MAVQKGGDRVVVRGLSDFRRAIKDLGDTSLTDELRNANRAAAQIVVDRAAPSMASAGGIGVRLARTMKAGKVQTRGQLSLSPVRVRGRSFLPLGVEFGADQNVTRFIKNTGGRATRVGAGRDASRVRANVERQYVGSRGSLDRRGGGGQQVQVIRTMKGWNQFRPWRGNGNDAGYHIFPALRAEQGRIIDLYGDELDRLYRKAFPE